MLQNVYFPKEFNSKKLALACSGGLDSMVLFHRLIDHKLDFVVFHCNFQLRGIESDTDENFVKAICKKNQILFYSKSFDTNNFAKQSGRSVEMEARHLRYSFFWEMKEKLKIDFVLTAHHLQDNIETQWLRFIKGGSIEALRGMPKLTDWLYRPFLAISKAEIQKYAQDNNVVYREDKSNQENIYQRNIIRNELLPIAHKINPNLASAFYAIASQAESYSAMANYISKPFQKKFLKTKKYDLSELIGKDFASVVIFQLFKDKKPNRAQIEEIAKNLTTTETKTIEIGSEKWCVKNGILEPIVLEEFFQKIYFSIEELEKCTFIKATLVDYPCQFQRSAIYLNPIELQFPLTIRSPLASDKIRPLGMGGKSKKLSDIFTLKKMTMNQKSAQKVILDKNNEILGIIGLMQSELTKIEPNQTIKILKIEE